MTEFLQQIVNGLFLGGVYALFAVGLTLSLGVARVMNLAHGVTLSIAAIAGVKLSTDIDIAVRPVVYTLDLLWQLVLSLSHETQNRRTGKH